MLITVLTLIAVLQTQSVKPQDAIQTVSVPIGSSAPASTETPTQPEPEAAQDEEPAYESEPELPTRQVCRYVQVTGQRFPVRTCRTVTIYPDDAA